MSARIARIGGGMILALFSLAAVAQTQTLHEEQSLYRNILVQEDDATHQRCMRFVLRAVRIDQLQSCVDLRDPARVVFQYTHSLLVGLLANPGLTAAAVGQTGATARVPVADGAPAVGMSTAKPRILIIGLGGGTLPRAFATLLPEAQITTVELDPAVQRVARQYFFYPADNPHLRTVPQDGRFFVRRASRQGTQWDYIVLDAFNGDYIPEHLMTREFLEEVRQILAPGGLLAANTFSISRLYHHESVTYQAVFPHLRMLKEQGNRVLFAAMQPFDFTRDARVLSAVAARFDPLGISVNTVLAKEAVPDWDPAARVLTDQYSPANLLNH